ncbi:hypothetical protein DSO57_1025774 [Entomophthora muscae]|uniref:Uncharacterized protein n=1 Tax=Entomophthora muscae TaxID=34485 RepID=A0ACC2TP97_9FUNG|nr:hypothetical protein DSO57_1025774 [Entomophthora muscae]
MTLFLISYNTNLVLLVVIPAMKDVSATAGLMKMATLPEINMEYWVEYRDLILYVDGSFAVDKVLAFNWIVSPPVALAIGNQVASARPALVAEAN